MNAIKHGKASEINIGLNVDRHGGVLMIADNGTGFDVVARRESGLGLRIMKYRTRVINGSLTVDSCPRDGTMITCSFPGADRISGTQYVA